MRTLRTAVIGLGRVGWGYHLPSLAEHPGFDLIAVGDPLQERMEEGARKYGIKGYTSCTELLEMEKPDLLVVASPTPYHAEQAMEAMRRGIDVFLEKPMAMTLAEADAMIEVMKEHGRKLMVYQPKRLSPEIRALRSILARDLIGPVYMIKRTTSRYVRRNDWQSMKKHGGGQLNNAGAHFIDQLLYLANSPARRISCHLRGIAALGDADDVVKALIETENGIVLDLDINQAAAIPFSRKWHVLGARGTIVNEVSEDGREFFRIRYFHGHDLGELALRPELAAPGRTYDNADRIAWRTEEVFLDRFPPGNFYDLCYAYYGLGDEPFVPIRETREVTRVIEECRKYSER